MKKTRRTFPFFRPRECDGFAEYLQKQCMQGWHFKEWRFGMVFEKGEPKAENYRVEIFPKGAEMDMRPGENTKEYAEYCEAAGWEFIDSRGKTCIFKQEVEDAVPIVEQDRGKIRRNMRSIVRLRGGSSLIPEEKPAFLSKKWRTQFQL